MSVLHLVIVSKNEVVFRGRNLKNSLLHIESTGKKRVVFSEIVENDGVFSIHLEPGKYRYTMKTRDNVYRGYLLIQH